MIKKFGLLGMMFCLTSGTALADTLKDVMAYSYENNLIINAQRAGQKALDETVAQAKSGYRPVVAGQADVARAKYKNTYDNAAIANKQKSYLTPTDISLSFTQPLFSGLTTVNSVQAAKDTVRAGRSDLMNTEQAVLLDTVAVYMDVIRDEAVLKLQKNN